MNLFLTPWRWDAQGLDEFRHQAQKKTPLVLQTEACWQGKFQASVWNPLEEWFIYVHHINWAIYIHLHQEKGWTKLMWLEVSTKSQGTLMIKERFSMLSRPLRLGRKVAGGGHMLDGGFNTAKKYESQSRNDEENNFEPSWFDQPVWDSLGLSSHQLESLEVGKALHRYIPHVRGMPISPCCRVLGIWFPA